MPKHCCVPRCTANKAKNEELAFCLLPTKGQRRQQWLSAINRAEVNDKGVQKNKLWSPKGNYLYVCGSHFITGELLTHRW